MSSLLAAGHYFGICILRPDSARPCIGDFNPELINADGSGRGQVTELIIRNYH